MRKFYFFLLCIFLCTGFACAAGRVQNSTSKKDTPTVSTRQPSATKNSTVSRSTTNRAIKSTQTDTPEKRTVSRTAINKTVSARPITNTRKTVQKNNGVSRRVSRAATLTDTTTTRFGNDYNTCRDSYFACMDQFCANQNDTYRRCICSSRLPEIQKQEKLLSQTAENLQDFQNLNIDVISKTSDEVKSMLSASDGETATKIIDTSLAAKTLDNISDILKQTKRNALSTQGTLDIAGDIKNIWTTTDFIGGSDIANLSGEALYNAVHSQCSEFISGNCTASDLEMVTATYGMYIENDCSVLTASIDNRMTAANAAIRATRHQMQDARLENYDAHNSLSVNDCIARVRQDITSDTACGENYVHCLDFSGKYLDLSTGKPIYSSDFYQLENQLSLSDDVLKNKSNVKFVNMLNKKRIFAEQSLNLCTDDADTVWDEFLRQSIVEIYQQQLQRVQDVKSECLAVVNECYLNKSDSLLKFSDNSSLISLGHTLELSEDLCADKLTTCSNLYGGGPEGLSVLVNTMREITNETIAQTCPELLRTFAQNICAVSSGDSGHKYPYGCRVYAPGEAMYANTALCNSTLINPFSRSAILPNEPVSPDVYYTCESANKRYTSCKFNYYLYDGNTNNETGYSQTAATQCHICPAGYICTGGTNAPQNVDQTLYESCGLDYIGSLYQQLVRYAIQNCTRPSNNSYVLPESILADVDTVMRDVKTQLISELAYECEEAYSHTWVDIPWVDDDSDGYHDVTGDTLFQAFYTLTGTNKLWGYCK